MLRELVSRGVFAAEPFMLIDVGCSLGLDPAWRLFGDCLHAHGFDPQLEEIARLRHEETNPNIQYHAGFVGLPGEPVPPPEDDYFFPFYRSSAMKALERVRAAGEAPFHETNDWGAAELSSSKVALGDFLRNSGVGSVDFVKTDTDWSDFEVLRSVEEMIRPVGVLGFMVETWYAGSDAETANTFHNVDRFMKRHGFLLASITVNRYSRAVLPAPFVYRLRAQTVWGQPLWGDVVYLREGAHPGYASFGELSPTKLLKLAALYELFSVPDCAVEILLAHRDRLSPLVEVDQLLDSLTPQLDDKDVPYREYIATFEADPTRFYPAPPKRSIKDLIAQILGPGLTERLQRLRTRLSGARRANA